MSFVGLTVLYSLRVNMSVVMTMIAETNHVEAAQNGTINSSAHNMCSYSAKDVADGARNTSTIQQAKFQWSSHLQELLLGAYFIGQTIGTIPSGWLSDRFGGKWLMGVGAGVSALMNIAAPLAIEVSVPLFFFTRLVSGLAEIGLQGALPYYIFGISMVAAACLSDHILHKRYLTKTTTRKLMTNTGSVVAAISLATIPHVGCDHRFVVALMSTGMLGVGIAYSGIFANPSDLAPRFAGTVFAIGNCLGVACGFVGPVVIGFMTEDQSDPKGWGKVFYMTAGLSLQLLGTGEVQAWALPGNEVENEVKAEMEDKPALTDRMLTSDEKSVI
ncbi:putative inorganic phosphate cotransporter [Diadema setosum]|uniref:putative inorganic phosphate cotransporter n=1 Tax=Diadema setosum TaxID=31175 RepID=UPI003B3A7814